MYVYAPVKTTTKIKIGLLVSGFITDNKHKIVKKALWCGLIILTIHAKLVPHLSPTNVFLHVCI